jgi:hypothetical protein
LYLYKGGSLRPDGCSKPAYKLNYSRQGIVVAVLRPCWWMLVGGIVGAAICCFYLVVFSPLFHVGQMPDSFGVVVLIVICAVIGAVITVRARRRKFIKDALQEIAKHKEESQFF